ncbi:MAG: stage II sporulation protein M [Polyangiaceae bacterium]|nr:stage II sporulation protein M [Polyangiaceae bacterium]
MIVDLEQFVAKNSSFWDELAALLARIEQNPDKPFTLAEAEKLHYLYQRAVSGLGRISGLPPSNELRRYLEALVARAHVELHDARRRGTPFRPLAWFFGVFPRTFRRHFRAFLIASLVTLLGALFGGFALAVDDTAKDTLLPFSHLLGDPKERVLAEEAGDVQDEGRGTFASFLFQNNLSVSIRTLAFGLFWGIGSVLLLFYNGVILGAVCFDYVRAGEGVFLAGWLLPHGATEIPSILIAGQAGILLGRAIIGWADETPLVERLRSLAPDLVTLIGGVGVLLVCAALVESFLSQHHAPVLPYAAKIAFGVVELIALGAFLGMSGRQRGLPGRRWGYGK